MTKTNETGLKEGRWNRNVKSTVAFPLYAIARAVLSLLKLLYLIGMVYYWNRQTVNLNRVSKNQRLIWVSCNRHRHIHRSNRFDIFHLAVRNSVAAAPLWHR